MLIGVDGEAGRVRTGRLIGSGGGKVPSEFTVYRAQYRWSGDLLRKPHCRRGLETIETGIASGSRRYFATLLGQQTGIQINLVRRDR